MWSKCGPNAAQVRPKCGPSAAQVRPKCGPNVARMRPEFEILWPEINPWTFWVARAQPGPKPQARNPARTMKKVARPSPMYWWILILVLVYKEKSIQFSKYLVLILLKLLCTTKEMLTMFKDWNVSTNSYKYEPKTAHKKIQHFASS